MDEAYQRAFLWHVCSRLKSRPHLMDSGEKAVGPSASTVVCQISGSRKEGAFHGDS